MLPTVSDQIDAPDDSQQIRQAQREPAEDIREPVDVEVQPTEGHREQGPRAESDSHPAPRAAQARARDQIGHEAEEHDQAEDMAAREPPDAKIRPRTINRPLRQELKRTRSRLATGSANASTGRSLFAMPGPVRSWHGPCIQSHL
jgi:hypothetical protein